MDTTQKKLPPVRERLKKAVQDLGGELLEGSGFEGETPDQEQEVRMNVARPEKESP